MSTPQDEARLLHELQVHQSELQLQNEELLDSRAKLEAALSQYAELYEHAPVGYFTLARDGAIRRVNLRGAVLLGVERGRLLGRRLGSFVADAAVFNGWLAQIFTAADSKPVCELALAADGRAPREPLFVRLSGSIAPSGEECRAILVDVTRQRLAEEHLRRAQKMEALGQLAGGVAHDFNNLLTVILSHTDLAGERLGPSDPQQEDLRDIRTAAERAAELTGQLLAFARKQVVRPQSVDVNALVQETVSLLGRTIGQHVELHLDLCETVGSITIDPGQLEQVLINVAINARDAMPRGGQLTIATASVESSGAGDAHRDGLPPGRYVRLTVTDTGCGMTPDTQAHLFEPFFTTKGPERGTGLGLATVYGIMKQCDGEIAVRSEPGRGTEFAFYFPRASAPALPAAPPQAAPGPQARGETVLLVEDEPALRRVIKRILVRDGYQVLEVADGAEALALCAAHRGPIDLVLSDVIMPRMTGQVLAQQLKGVRPGARVLLMSGYVMQDVAHGGPLDPAQAFLSKPFSPVALSSAVRDLLDAAPPGQSG